MLLQWNTNPKDFVDKRQIPYSLGAVDRKLIKYFNLTSCQEWKHVLQPKKQVFHLT